MFCVFAVVSTKFKTSLVLNTLIKYAMWSGPKPTENQHLHPVAAPKPVGSLLHRRLFGSGWIQTEAFATSSRRRAAAERGAGLCRIGGSAGCALLLKALDWLLLNQRSATCWSRVAWRSFNLRIFFSKTFRLSDLRKNAKWPQKHWSLYKRRKISLSHFNKSGKFNVKTRFWLSLKATNSR